MAGPGITSTRRGGIDALPGAEPGELQDLRRRLREDAQGRLDRSSAGARGPLPRAPRVPRLPPRIRDRYAYARRPPDRRLGPARAHRRPDGDARAGARTEDRRPPP